MRLLITGGLGFVGKNLILYLLERHSDLAITIIDNLSRYNKPEDVGRILSLRNVRWLKFDLKDGTLCLRHIRDVDAVIHLAARTNVAYSIQNPAESLNCNIVSTVNVLEACRINGIPRILFASTAAVHGQENPDTGGVEHSPYGLSKKICEETVRLYGRLYGIRYACLRFFNLYGPYQYAEDPCKNVIGMLFQAKRQGTPFTIYGGNQTRDFVYIDDLCTVIDDVLMQDWKDLCLEIGKGTVNTIYELVETFQMVTGHKLDVNVMPSRKGEVVHSRISNNNDACTFVRPSIGLEEGLKRMHTYHGGTP